MSSLRSGREEGPKRHDADLAAYLFIYQLHFSYSFVEPVTHEGACRSDLNRLGGDGSQREALLSLKVFHQDRLFLKVVEYGLHTLNESSIFL